MKVPQILFPWRGERSAKAKKKLRTAAEFWGMGKFGEAVLKLSNTVEAHIQFQAPPGNGGQLDPLAAF